MRRYSLLVALLSGCLHHHTHLGIDGAVLGRVVVYRNGVAFYERNATVKDGKLEVHVPRDRVDDFLKSLTVVDRSSRKPLSISIPRKEADDGSYLTMVLETPERDRADVMLTYVTEAPAWKPSYRVVVGNQGKVMLEGWAIVDNVSGEDWKGVLVGVGASSALAFRYDLWSVHRIDRDLLQGEDRFAIAPPTGVSPYAEASAGGSEELVSLGADEVRGDLEGKTSVENTYVVDGVKKTTDKAQLTAPVAGGTISGVVTDSKSGQQLPGVTVIVTSPAMTGTQTAISDDHGAYTVTGLPPGTYQVTFYYADVTAERSGVKLAKDQLARVSQKINGAAAGGEVITVTGSAPVIDQGSTSTGITITRDYGKRIPVPGRTFESALGAAAGSQTGDGLGESFSGSTSSGNIAKPPPPPPPVAQGDAKLRGIAQKLVSANKDVVIEAHGGTAGEASKRAEAVRNKLIDEGVPAKRIHVTPKVGDGDGIRVLAVAPGAAREITAPPTAGARGNTSDTPVGESHFESDRPMNVRAGSSAMVAMLHRETTGGVVYLYDPLSDRGDQRFAFKSVRLDNPTGDTLEPGPVTVYGAERFIGEGITEPVPPHASVVVPFALDKQVVVKREGAESDRIAKLVTVEHGIITAEVQHRRNTTFTVTSRLTEPSKVYLRHRLESGWQLVKAPSTFTKVGDSQLFEVDLGPAETKVVTIAEETPIERRLELGSDEALGMMKLYVDEPEATTELKAQLAAVFATHRTAAELVDKIQTLREQLAEYRSREGELHGQIMSLRLVRTGGELMTSLKGKLAETSDRIQKATIAIVEGQEQLMLLRIKFQNQLAELHLSDPALHKPYATR